MSSCNTPAGLKSIPIFTGTGWQSRANKVKAYAQLSEYWDHIEGVVSSIPALPTTIALTWSEQFAPAKAVKDQQKVAEQVTGLLCSRVSEHIRDRIYADTLHLNTPKAIWDWIKNTYNRSSPAEIFNIFAKAVCFRLHANQDPTTEHLRFYFTFLKENNCDLPNFIQAMVLAASIPKEWQGLSTTIFQI